MNLAEVDQEILREPTLYYWEVLGVAAGYDIEQENGQKKYDFFKNEYEKFPNYYVTISLGETGGTNV